MFHEVAALSSLLLELFVLALQQESGKIYSK